jgi:hypothetical protein
MLNPDQQFWWNWWVNVSVAIATFSAAFVALFGQKLQARFFPPILRLRLLRREGERAPITRQNNQGAVEQVDDSRYYHLHVWNERRWSPADQVQVYLRRLDEPGPSGDAQVAWTGDVPLRWRHQEFVPLLRTIGSAQDCDFCAVLKKERRLSLMPLLFPNNLNAHRQGKCSFVAWVQARSNQADSRVLRIRVSWDGLWEDGATEMQRHLFCCLTDSTRFGGSRSIKDDFLCLRQRPRS